MMKRRRVWFLPLRVKKRRRRKGERGKKKRMIPFTLNFDLGLGGFNVK